MASEESPHPQTDTKPEELKPSTGESRDVGEALTCPKADSGLAESEPSTNESRDTIGEAAALEVAAQALKAYDPLPGDSQPTIELKGDRYIVTYPRKLPHGVRGSSFHVKVHIDAKSGKVLGLQGGV